MMSCRRSTGTGICNMDVSVILFYREDRGWLDRAVSSYHIQAFSGTSELIIVHGERSTAENLNIGCRQAKGDFIKYLCDDDELLPGCLQALYDKAVQGYDVVCAAALNVNVNTGETTVYQSTIPGQICELADRNTIHGGTVLFRSEALKQVGYFDETLKSAEEYDCYLKLAAAGFRFGKITDPVYLYRIHDRMKSMQTMVIDGQKYLERKREILHRVQYPYLTDGRRIRL